ncbi:polysaccharide deacetylase family protein [Catellatospora sp. KI3]|uniref:polysaccharide deacetylase family protein n=1 Tax=Catellatospora sp. KI3 TaxID=3041620 RepID=UPI00248283ED|nr:polysaccharide deacetylase family protein [Catellatospora sp. KI3]MDI1462406.1 polysaccharide deacetylase family protein [Catellatospora sp. KI3]
MPAALALVAAVLGAGFLLGRVSGGLGATRAWLTGASPGVHGENVAEVGGRPAALAPLPPRAEPVTGPGRPPLAPQRFGPAGSRYTTGTPEVALTFDDGPDPTWTPIVVALLHEYRVKATFCLIGANVVKYPQLVRDIAAEGHTLCNHSWSHDLKLGRREPRDILADLRRTNRAIQAAVPGARVSYFRQPGGEWTEAAVAAARRLGMTALHWQVDPKDWGLPLKRPAEIAALVDSATRDGSIVLLHDGGGDRGGTAMALRTILPRLLARFHLAALPPGVDPPRRYGLDRPEHPGQR